MNYYHALKIKPLLNVGFAILMFCSGLGYANTNDDIATLNASNAEQLSSVSSATLETLKTHASQNQSEHRTLIDAFMKEALSSTKKKRPQGADGAILFVSFSMPESLLFELADEAAIFGIPVVIKGLVDNDFKKTIETFSRLNREAQKKRLNFTGVSIDPVWFQQFNITSVPALVVSQRPESCLTETVCNNQPFDVVYGNAHIRKGLELIASRGDAAPLLAQKILERGHV